jgi:hypothetical protein
MMYMKMHTSKPGLHISSPDEALSDITKTLLMMVATCKYPRITLAGKVTMTKGSNIAAMEFLLRLTLPGDPAEHVLSY